MAITNYCIIDHVGSLTQEQISPAYDKIYTIAKNDGFEKKFCFTLKAVCQKAWNPYSRTALTQDKLKSMKIAMRYQKKTGRSVDGLRALIRSTALRLF